MNRRTFITLLCAGTVFFAAPSARADDWFDFKAIMRTLQNFFFPPPPHYDYDPRMIRAAEIAESHANSHQTWLCWKYVKNALVEARVINRRPKTVSAKDAGTELCDKFGFTKLPIRNPNRAPVGAVLVYIGGDASHVELRTKTGFVSDFISRTHYPLPLSGVYVKPS